jgi:hypothetical protein
MFSWQRLVSVFRNGESYYETRFFRASTRLRVVQAPQPLVSNLGLAAQHVPSALWGNLIRGTPVPLTGIAIRRMTAERRDLNAEFRAA